MHNVLRVTPDGLAHLATVLSAALKRPAEERDTFLQAYGLDEDMRALVAALASRSASATHSVMSRMRHPARSMTRVSRQDRSSLRGTGS